MTNKPKPRFVDKEEIHPAYINNVYLLSGYRHNFDTFKLSLKSMLMIHNEFMNIWTHLIGTVCFIILMIAVISSYANNAAIHSTLRNNFKVTDALRSMADHYNENMGLLLDIIKHPDTYKEFTANYDTKKNSGVFLHAKGVVLKYQEILEQFISNIENDEINFLREFNDNYEYLKKGIRNTIRILLTKFESLFQDSHIEPSRIVEKVKRCFHYDSVHDLLTSMLYPHLEYFPIVIYVICVIACLGFSTTFHTFKCVSRSTHKILHRLDMAGISILNFGSSYSILYYAFYCRPIIRNIYPYVLLIACLTVFFVSLGDKIHQFNNIKYKGIMFASLGLSNVVPFTHLCIISAEASEHNDNMPFNMAFIGFLIMAVLYLTGLVIYVKKFPERYYPKKFDIWMNSHTIWHVFVLAAAVVHFFNILYMYEMRKHIHCISC